MKLKSNVETSDNNCYGFVIWNALLPYRGGPGYHGVIYSILRITPPKNFIYKSIIEANEDCLKLSTFSFEKFAVYAYKEAGTGG